MTVRVRLGAELHCVSGLHWPALGCSVRHLGFSPVFSLSALAIADCRAGAGRGPGSQANIQPCTTVSHCEIVRDNWESFERCGEFKQERNLSDLVIVQVKKASRV